MKFVIASGLKRPTMTTTKIRTVMIFKAVLIAEPRIKPISRLMPNKVRVKPSKPKNEGNSMLLKLSLAFLNI